MTIFPLFCVGQSTNVYAEDLHSSCIATIGFGLFCPHQIRFQDSAFGIGIDFLLRRIRPLFVSGFNKHLITVFFNLHSSIWLTITMRESSGLFHPCPVLKSFFSDKVGGMIFGRSSAGKYRKQVHELEKKLVESIKQRAGSGQNSFRSVNSIIMRFPQFKEGLRYIKEIFEKYDKDSNGTIDHEELKQCLSDLQAHVSEMEIDVIYHYCDADGKEGIQFNEFIVLLGLIYLLMEPAPANQNISRIGSRKLEATFDTIVEAFSFLDKSGDGKLKRKEVILALGEVSPGEKSPTHITTKRFKELDWNKDGKVNFKEFLFALTKWVGFDSDEENEYQ